MMGIFHEGLETCVCGARIEVTGDTTSVNYRLREFREAHTSCRMAWNAAVLEHGLPMPPEQFQLDQFSDPIPDPRPETPSPAKVQN